MAEVKNVSIELVGRVLDEDLYTDFGGVLLSRGVTLTEQHLRNLIEQGKVKTLKIVSSGLLDEREGADTAFQQYVTSYKQNIKQVEKLFEQASVDRLPPLPEVKESFKPIFERTIHDSSFLPILHTLKENDVYTYQHSLNVGIISSVIGKLLNFSVEDQYLLGIMGILHDVGKSKIPIEIVTKTSELSTQEWDLMKVHPVYGANMLKKMNEVNRPLIQAALLHHERLDGSGYPFGCKENHIPFHVQLISVADTYDAITSERCYKPRQAPFTGVNELMECTLKNQMNPAITIPFTRYLMQQYTRRNVVLNNDVEAEIIFIHEHEPQRPLLKIKDDYVDLRKHPELRIVDVLT